MQSIAETCVRFDAAHLSINLVSEIAVPMFPTLITLEGFTTMVANEGLEKAEPIEPGPPGLTALHPLRRMRCELFQVKHLQEHTYSFLGEGDSVYKQQS